MNTSTAVLINPLAGGGQAARLIQPIQAFLKSIALELEVYVANDLSETLQWVMNRPIKGRLIVVGGDGTISQLLPGLLQRQLELAIIPWGSGNDCARELKVHQFTWQDAFRLAIQQPSQAMDVGLATFEVNGQVLKRPFLSSFSCGFDAEVALQALQGPRFLSGKLRYLYATIKSIFNLQIKNLTIKNNDVVVHQGATLLASSLNTRTFGGGLPAAPHANAFDQQINLLIAGNINKISVLALLPLLNFGKHLGQREVFTHPYQNLCIQSQQALAIAADGEFLGFTHEIQLSLGPQKLAVVVG
jgi:diacylglycerol kinase family enzyme